MHWLRQWWNRGPRPEDYLPFSTTHQHKQAWKWPFLGMAGCLLIIVVLLGILLGQQAQFDDYVEENRETLCQILDVQQQQAAREFPAHRDLQCEELR